MCTRARLYATTGTGKMCKHFRIVNILLVFHIYSVTADSRFDAMRARRLLAKQSRGIMSPKMDYDEWTPLGRGDPLKNDPTFDYSPPMVSKVKYWINPLYRTPDPPIMPSKDEPTTFATVLMTKSGHHYRATTIPSATVGAAAYASTESSSIVAAGSDIKRFIIEPSVAVDTSHAQPINSKYNQKLSRQPPLASVSAAARQPATSTPPAPLLMLVPPPPVEPSSYTSTKIENSTAVELSWNVKTHLQPYLDQFSTTTPSIVSAAIELSKGTQTRTTTSKSILQHILGKEKFSESRTTFATSTVAPPAFTPNPLPFSVKQMTAFGKPVKASSHLIIQGHSKVKKYGGSSMAAAAVSAKMAERVDQLSPQETNEISDVKFELPIDVRERKQLNVEDFLPFGGFFGDFFAAQEEGSGFGADEGTRAILSPPYLRSSSSKSRHQRNARDDDDELMAEQIVI